MSLRRLLLALPALLLLGAAGIAGTWWHWTRAALPTVDGSLQLPGLKAAVTVRRDGSGVPHIQAASLPDVFLAQGYVTAQDRLWHMDLLRRRALGELAEAFGEGALRADREIRTLGLGQAAREAEALLPPDIRGFAESYRDGVNAYIAQNRDRLPVEFRLLAYEPRPWTVVDTLAVGKLLALDLAQGWEAEAFRAVVADKLPPEMQDLLYPRAFPYERLLVGADGATPPPAPGSGEETSRGSNNWVISGAHTATGKPMLANDPHLGLGVPSIWTVVHLTAPGLDVAGVTLPGAPGVVIGRNRDIAWGCTNVHDDSADLYVERFDTADPDRYAVPGGWERAVTRRESIRVRQGLRRREWRDERLDVRSTRHGPLVEIQGRLYALRWTTLQQASELTAFLRLDQAGGRDDFLQAVALFPGPSQNFVYADKDGGIGWYSAGRLPMRRSGDGARPYDGASDAGDWTGFVPFEQLPHLMDPPSGRIVTANNRLVGPGYPHVVTRGGIAPWRAATLFQALESRAAWTTDDVAALQGERLSLPLRDLARALLAAAARHPGDSGWADVSSELGSWDGRMDAGSRAAARVQATFRAIGARVIRPRLQGVTLGDRLERRLAPIHHLILEQPTAWLPAGMADWDAVLLASWNDATSSLEAALGADRQRWSWGELNRMAVGHPLTRAAPALARLFNPPAVAIGGHATTPNVLTITPQAVEAPSMRFVASMADADDTRLVNFMGQSGHVASPHYGDQFDDWVGVRSRRLPFTEAAVAREARHTLQLLP